MRIGRRAICYWSLIGVFIIFLFACGDDHVVLSKNIDSSISVYLGSNQKVKNGIREIVKFTSEIYDVKNEFENNFNYDFTAFIDGKYLVSGQIAFSGLDVSNTVELVIQNNAITQAASIVVSVGVNAQLIQVSKVLYLSAEDVVVMSIQPFGNDITVWAGMRLTFMTITRLH